MKRTEVKSSQITSVGHDKATNTLEIEFRHDGSVYQYTNVSAAMHTMLMTADSVGSWFAKNIKKFPARYPFTKVTANAPAVPVPPIEEEGDWVEQDIGVQGIVTGRLDTTPVKRNPDTLKREVTDVVTRAQMLSVTNNTQYVAAAEFLKGVKALQGDVDATFDDIIATAHQAHKVALAKKKEHYDPLATAERVVKALMNQYTAKVEADRVAEENRIRREHEDRIKAQAQEENLKRAQELTEQGDLDGAAAAVDAEVEVPEVPVHVPSALPKVEGVSSRKGYEVERVDLNVLMRAVLDGKAPAECVNANWVFLGKQARAFKKTGEIIPGVFAKEVTGTAASGK